MKREQKRRATGGRKFVVAGFGGRCQQTWAEALDAPQVLELAAEGNEPRLVLAFYQPPWEAFLEAASFKRFTGSTECTAWLAGWLEYHQRLLADCESQEGKVLLVNGARLRRRSAELLALLAAEGVALPEGIASATLEPWSVAGDHTIALGYQLQELAPEAWDVYEALESVAKLLGREPEFRAIDPQANGRLGGLLFVCSEAIAARIHDSEVGHRNGQLRAKDEEVAKMKAQLDEVRANAVSEAALSEIRLENELQARMLLQMQEELHHQVGSNHELRGELARCADASENAITLISRLAPPRA